MLAVEIFFYITLVVGEEPFALKFPALVPPHAIGRRSITISAEVLAVSLLLVRAVIRGIHTPIIVIYVVCD